MQSVTEDVQEVLPLLPLLLHLSLSPLYKGLQVMFIAEDNAVFLGSPQQSNCSGVRLTTRFPAELYVRPIIWIHISVV